MHERPLHSRGLAGAVIVFFCLSTQAPLVLAATTASVERLRTIPEDAAKGIMMPPLGRRVQINDTMMMLAPGATIRDMKNRMVLPSTLRRPKKVRYTLDMYGQVKRIWISPTGGLDRPRFQPPTPHD